MNSVISVLSNFESLPDNAKKEILLYADSFLDQNRNKLLLEATLTFLKNSERFCGPLLE